MQSVSWVVLLRLLKYPIGHDTVGNDLVFEGTFKPTGGMYVCMYALQHLTLVHTDQVAIKRYSLEWLFDKNHYDMIVASAIPYHTIPYHTIPY